MRRLIIFALLIFTLGGFQSKRSDFSGSWKLDLEKSVDLPATFKNVEAYSMDVRQTADSMVVVVGLSGSGQSVKFPPTMYAFDTSEVYREDTLRGSKRWSKCAWETTGKKMIVTSKVRQKKASGELVYTQKDVWQLNDLKTMQIVITQSFAKGDSVHSERRIFHLVM